jgi:hypothetical protein
VLNLWKIYKYVSQRAARAVTLSQGVIAADMAQAMKIILDKPTIKNARQFATYEKSYLSHCDSKTKSRLYAPEVIIAIRSKAYIVEKPPINIFGLSDNNPSQGYVYVATSARRLREVKLGFTTLSLESRAQKFRSKYGYVDF